MRFRDQNVVAEARRRLRRVEGQVGGIVAMIEEGRSCQEVIQQIAAASKALDRVGCKLLVSQLQYCLEDEEAARAEGYDLADMERLFLILT